MVTEFAPKALDRILVIGDARRIDQPEKGTALVMDAPFDSSTGQLDLLWCMETRQPTGGGFGE
jgi:hypothetical protein